MAVDHSDSRQLLRDAYGPQTQNEKSTYVWRGDETDDGDAALVVALKRSGEKTSTERKRAPTHVSTVASVARAMSMQHVIRYDDDG